MEYLALETIQFKNKTVRAGDTFNINNEDAIKPLIEQGKVRPSELLTLPITSWLEKLSDSERARYEERAAIMEYDGGLPREQAEVEAIKRIIRERVISGKCDRCERVSGCMMTKGQRGLCEVVRA